MAAKATAMNLQLKAFVILSLVASSELSLSILALCFIFLLGIKTELSTLVQVLQNLRDDLWYASDHSQQGLDFISEKVRAMELRMDMTGGSTWDTLRHLKQHFEEFDPQAGGAALFSEFLVKKRWALLSGPVSHWDQEAQFTEWDLLLSTAILATREGVMYNRFLRALYSRTASDEELRQETLVVENTQRPELSVLWARHQPENDINELLASAHAFSCAKQHWLSAHSREVGLRTKAERLNVLSSIDLSDVAEPDLLSQWNIEAEVEWHLSDLQAQNEF
ncbi:unnamed protein product [Cladocopium goreaui]|uniref:Uncharacterized protein n=1 Tax=Cladocopium goreaui TaxID=2562237 RepID=A0A9P1CJR5_9DINO|nr:unnamed protein product [Cladocopium goreaui]